MSVFIRPVLAVVFLIVIGCGGNGNEEDPPVEEAPPEATAKPQAVTEDKLQEESHTYGGDTASMPSLEDIREIRIVTVSDDPRDGFRAEIIYADSEESRRQNYIYDWQLNGEDITGEVGEELEWKDGFKKGDTITVSVTPYNDLGQGTRSASGGFQIPNSPPRILSAPDPKFEQGRFSYTVRAEDPDGDPLDFTLRNAPPGMIIEPATGLIVWEFDEQDAGTYTVTIIVSDSEGAKASQELTLSIEPQDNVYK
jgi:hypothetical protein